jgi:hypothetical protein
MLLKKCTRHKLIQGGPSPENGNPQTTSDAKGGDDVQDVDFEEVKE